MKATALDKTDSPTLVGIDPRAIGSRFVQKLKTILHRDRDLHHLPPHLRRDAGIDELEIERTKAVRAPLIRSKF